MIKIKLNQSVE